MRIRRSLRVVTFLLVCLPAALSQRAQTTATESVLYKPSEGSVGVQPIQGVNGLFYGSADNVYSISDTGNYAVIASGLDSSYSPLTQGTDGNFYGTTKAGGAQEEGSVFVVSPTGTYTQLYSFCGKSCEGPALPLGALVQGTDGNFYGTTAEGGSNNTGTIYKITSAGALTIVDSVCDGSGCAEGSSPNGALVQGSNGNFYGVTEDGGGGGHGEIFEVTPSGTATVLYSFCGLQCLAGGAPFGPLVEDAAGNFYGINIDGGANSHGTVFQLTPSGSLNTLYSFCSQTGCTDGSSPQGGLTLGSDGNLYGVTETGGTEDDGVVYQITPAGTYTVLYSFCSLSGCADGTSPSSAPIQDSYTGNFIGVAGYLYELALTPSVAPPVQMTLSKSAINLGQTVSFTYKVRNAFSTTLQQCYAFQSVNGALTTLGQVPGALANGVYAGSGTFSPSAYGIYTYSITCGGQETATANLSVGAATAITLTASPNPVDFSQSITLTATVTTQVTQATGTVNFVFAGQTLASAELANGVATYTVGTLGLPPGTYAITAVYTGDATHNPATSSAYSVVLDKAPTTTLFAVSPDPVEIPNPVLLTATVSRSAAGSSGTPTGTVTFYYLTTAVATATLNSSGVASVTASTKGLPEGTYSLTAHYNGDTSDAASTSQAVKEPLQ